MTIYTGYGTVQAMRYTNHKNHVVYACKHCLLHMLLSQLSLHTAILMLR
jgi:hypothetical protein